MQNVKLILKKKFFLIALVLYFSPIHAVSSLSLPWEDPLERIIVSLTGPVAKMLGIAAIVIAGFGIAFGEVGSGVRRLLQIVLGLSIAFTASNLAVTLFGFSA